MEFNFETNKQKGFSLIELIIIILILSILAVASIPQIGKNLRSYNLETVSSVIADRLLETRLTAVKHNRPAWLNIDKTARTIKVFTTDNTNQNIQKGVTVNLPSDVVVDSAAPSNITFSSLGRNQSNAEILLKLKSSDQKVCRLIVVSAVGKVSSVSC